jgi:hypothetical protein
MQDSSGDHPPVPASDRYREGLGTVSNHELEWEHRRLSGALCGDDLRNLSADVRAALEGQLDAVRAEQAARKPADRPVPDAAPGPR